MVDVLFIIAQKDFRDEELLETKKILETGGKTCEVASITADRCVGMLGAKVTPNLSVKDALNKDYKAVVVVGGFGSIDLARYPEVIKIVQKANSKSKIVASICAGPTVLARAEVLNGKKATVYPAPQWIDVLTKSGAKYISDKVVIDGNIITGNGPPAARAFGQAILKALGV